MAIETQEKQIGDNVYVVEKFGAKQGRKLLLRLTRLLGPAFAALADGDDNALAGALRAFAATATEDDFEHLCEAFASKTKVKQTAHFASGPKDIETDLARVFDSHFAGNYSEMLGWLLFAIQTNYSDFLSAIKAGNVNIEDATRTR